MVIQDLRNCNKDFCFSCKLIVLIHQMVTQKQMRTRVGNQYFSQINVIYTTALDLNKCLKQIKLTISLYTCVPISDTRSKTNMVKPQLTAFMSFGINKQIVSACQCPLYMQNMIDCMQAFQKKIKEQRGANRSCKCIQILFYLT